jgi:oxygen-independent coproporphyrinogen-3 oxidase
LHLYCHIPFCASKCAYCGFYSVRAERDVIRSFPDALAKELSVSPLDVPPETIYLGGGTPSLLGAEGLERLASLFARRFPLDGLREWSMEVNPANATPELLRAARHLGVTRLSIGVQSFNDMALRQAGRPHSAAEARAVISAARAEGFGDIGIDLIAGLPGDTPGTWLATLRETLALGLRHVSVYALTVEPRTRLAAETAAGRIAVPDDSAMLALLSEAETILLPAGFERYEISNYAIPGFACRYNLAVWRGFDYLGLGPAAASRLGNRRRTHAADLPAYLAAVRGGMSPPDSSADTLGPLDDAIERSVYQLRLAEGMDFGALSLRFPVLIPRLAKWRETLAGLAPKGITEPTARGFRLTARGREVCDSVLAELV